MTYPIPYLDTQKLFRMRNTILHAFHHVDQQDMQPPKILQSVESVELPIDFSPSILEMESLNSYFIIKAAADGRRRLICQLPYLPAGISRWRFILVLECRLAFFPYTEHSSQTLAVLSSVVSGNTTGAEDGVSS